ncbi:MAG: thermonuclease family protein [Candidatus Zixiibacteriota bacterium]
MHIINSLKLRWLIVVLTAATLTSVAFGSEWFSGKVVSVKDGDTIGVMRDGKEVTVRLDGIDCPESNQDFGTRAKQLCSDLTFGKDVTVEVRDVDKYGRLVGRVYADYQDVSLALVRAGLAWHYVEYSDDANLQFAEIEARETQAGIWSMSNPVAPWQFRHPTAEATASDPVPSVSATSKTEAEDGVVFVTATGKKYHSENCRYLAKSKRAVTFISARAAGYLPCSVCGGNPTRADRWVPAPEDPSTGSVVASPAEGSAGVTVYITNSGSKYHSLGCRYLSKSCIACDLSSALARGLTPCSVCGPASPKSDNSPSYEVPSSSSEKTVKVKGYFRKDGTYVKPHTRSKPRRKN